MSQIAEILRDHDSSIVDRWVEAQRDDSRVQTSLISEDELRRQSQDVLNALIESHPVGVRTNGDIPAPLHRVLQDLAIRRDRVGMRPAGTAASILMLKDHLLPHLLDTFVDDRAAAISGATEVSRLIDSLALLAYEQMVQGREETITQQAEELLEISTPVVQVWDGVVAAPLIGMLDSERTQRFMERLLERIVETNSPVALVDITGVPAIDTQTAQHLIDTINAVKLLGSQVILTGVRPSIAQTLVHLGISLTGVRTRSSFAAGLRVAMEILELELSSTKIDPA